ncbi:hypothetical protein ABH916_003044 [Peribacillus frigoritolerans]
MELLQEAETVVSQIAEETFGRNFMYYFIQGTTALILILAANTGYSAFPLLAVNLAKDKFIPRMFTVRGDRLGYSNGIITLGLTSINFNHFLRLNSILAQQLKKD